MLHKFDEVLARGGLAAGTLKLDRIGAIGTLQRTAMGYFRKHRERNPESLRRRAALFQYGEPVGGSAARRTCVARRRTHEVLSRASLKNPLSARSWSMAMTSVAIALRSAVYFVASWSIIAPTLRTPSQS